MLEITPHVWTFPTSHRSSCSPFLLQNYVYCCSCEERERQRIMRSFLVILWLIAENFGHSDAFLQLQVGEKKRHITPRKILQTRNDRASSSPVHHHITSSKLIAPQQKMLHPNEQQLNRHPSLVVHHKLFHRLQLSSSSSEADSGSSSSGEVEEVKAPTAALVGFVGAIVHLFLRRWAPQYKTFSRFTLAAFMLGGASMRLDPVHLDKLLVHMVPPPLPPKLTAYASGLVEAICGVLLVIPSTAELGAILTVALLWAVYPSNIYMALSSKSRKATGTDDLKVALLIRIPIQLLFIYWASWFVKTEIAGPWRWFVW